MPSWSMHAELVTLHAMAGGMLAGNGDLEPARAHTEQAIALARRTGNPSALCSSLFAHAVAIRNTDPDRRHRDGSRRASC